METIKNFFLHPFVLSLLVGLLVFIFFYIRFPGILRFFQDKTLRSQKEVLEIADKMMIKAPKEKMILWLWALGLCFGFLIFLACWPNLPLGLCLGALGFLCSWLAVQQISRTFWEIRCHSVVAQMVEGLTIMTNGVKVGLSITQSLERVIKNMKGGPLAQEFQLILNKTHLGMSVEEAFYEMEQRIDRPDVTMMVTAINILKETGGNIGETLAIISETIRERQKVENKVKALTAQGTMQAMIISAVPFIMLLIMFAMNKNYAQLMLGTPLGLLSLMIIIILIALGGYMMKKIVTIKI